MVMVSAWQEVEITLTATAEIADPYTSVEVWAEFTCDDRTTLRRPAFHDGDRVWRIRFASPLEHGTWHWTSSATIADDGLHGISGSLTVSPNTSSNPFHRHGFWRMSPGGRSLIHADGTPALLIADTAWALPWRATEEQVRLYARDRQAKGFNAVLLMSVQPDMRAAGPQDRTADEGFDVGFHDLPTGHLNELNPAYFQYLDRLLDILIDHGIVPVLQPVFQGFGWKGLDVAGTVVPPQEYARYCRYLVARYGARPAVYLVGADGSGLEPQIEAGGREVHAWDCYQQPTGIHYRPHANPNAHQDAVWLDFQWCQTGHGGEHVPERVAGMWREYEGSTYVGLVGKILQGLPTTDMEPDWLTFIAPRGLRVPGKLHLVYQQFGGALTMPDRFTSAAYRIVDPKTGKTTASGTVGFSGHIEADPAKEPRVVIFERVTISEGIM